MELRIAISADLNNPDAGDLYLNDAGDAEFTTTLGQETAQRLTVRLNFYRGEWFNNLDEGTPWFQEILGQKPTEDRIRAIFTSVILGTPGVASIDKLSWTRTGRQLNLVFRARLTDGTALAFTNPFVVAF